MAGGYNNNPIMDGKDAVYGSLASCFITLHGRRYNFMQLTDFQSESKTNISEVKILGKVGMAHKASGANNTWKATAHYNQSVLREIALEFQKTGKMPYFTIQVTNEDPTSAVGRQTVLHYDCLIDNFTLAKFAAGNEILTEELSGTFERWDMPESFAKLPGME